jgi:alkylation response protein AidB-like acyl-CoA dehydrogenase
MANYSIDRRDLEFLLFEQFDLETVLKRDRYKELGRQEVDGIVDAAQALAIEVLGPTFAAADREGCKLVDGQVIVPKVYESAFKQLAEGGWIALNRSQDLGGMGLPIPLAAAITEMQIGAAASIGFYSGLTVAAGHLLENFAKPELKNLVVPKLYAGEWGGTMCLTEPHAGTAVGDLKTKAVPKGGDRYNIKGNKIFISAGDHQLTKNIVHLVLARVEGDPAGTKGISLFAVPKFRFDATGKVGERNDVTVTGIEHKMGINGSATCALSFGEADNCEGILIGERCQGIVYMFQMMNEARLACGIQGVAMGNYAYQLALAYARDRVQGAKVTDRTANPRQVKIIEHPDVRRNLMLCKSMGEGIRALLMQAFFYAEQAETAPTPEERQKNHDLLELITPVAKAYATDVGFKMTELAIQIHGGYGYIKEYGVEQILRDIKIASIYEGTNGIQALDLVGRKMRMKDGALVMNWLMEINQFIEANKSHPVVGADVAALDKAKNALAETAMAFATQSASNPDLALLGATPFLEMFGHVEVARLLIHQAIVASTKLQAVKPANAADTWVNDSAEGSDARFYDNKLKVAHFFANTMLPHVIASAKSVQAGDRSALDVHF